MNYTVADLVSDTLEHLQGTAHEEVNLLSTGMSAGTKDTLDTVTVTEDLGGIVPGVYLSIDDESMLVVTVSTVGASCRVLRGQNGSDPVAHGANAVVWVDPPWPRWRVMKTLREEIRSWGPQVYRVATETIDLVSGVLGYDLGFISPFFRVLNVRQTPPSFVGSVVSGSGGVTPVSNNKEWPQIPYVVDKAAPKSDFPSGNALILRSNQLTLPGVLQITYASPFDVDTAWSDGTDLIGNVGLDSSDLDIAPLGAAWKLLAFREPRRLFTQMQGQPRDANEVPALALMEAAAQFKTFRDGRLIDAQIRLLQDFPLEMEIGAL